MAIKFSVIIPVYNRPEEIDELLQSLTVQTNKNFDVLIIEDGSSQKCEEIVDRYKKSLDLQYFYKENSGQGFSRNYGFERATGDYFIVFDSDCIIPKNYFEVVEKCLQKNLLDVYGGPDKSHPDFSIIQKAISYSMTSPFTTGGIRGRKKHAGPFHPRSFNMGISKEVFKKIGGYIITRKGEDIEYSIRIINNGFRVGLITDAFVYHKRRTSLVQFYKQLHFFGTARINVGRFFPKEVRLIHWFPTLFLFGLIFWLSALAWSWMLFLLGAGSLTLFIVLIFLDSLRLNKSLMVALVSIPVAFIQLTAYGVGFLKESFRRG